MAKCNGKLVLFCGNISPDVKSSTDLSKIWYDWYTNDPVFLKSVSDFNNIYNKALIKTPPTKGVLYFASSSKFPRFKLSDTEFSRCIKPAKANYIVSNNVDVLQYGSEIYEDDNAYYIVTWNYKNRIYGYSYNHASVCYQSLCNNFEETIKKYKFHYGNNFHKVNSDWFMVSSKYANEAENILNGTYKNIMTDKMLDSYINSTFDKLTSDNIESIMDLLVSSDDTSKGLGLKLLTGFNITECPFTIRLMLSYNPSLSRLAEWNSVGMKQVRTSIGFRSFISMTDSPKYLIYNNEKISDYDMKLSKPVYKFYLKKALDTLLSPYIKVMNIFNSTISYEIKEL